MIGRLMFLFVAYALVNQAQCKGQAQQTQLGLRAGTSPSILKYYNDLDAKVSRQIILDHDIEKGNLGFFSSNLELFSNSGIVTIVCLRFPTDSSDMFNADRVPLLDSMDMQHSLGKVDSFLLALNGVLDYVQLQNEPLAGPGKYFNFHQNIHYGYYAIQWLDTLGKHIRHTIDKHNLDIKIISPAFHNTEVTLSNDVRENGITYIRAPGDTVKKGTQTTDILPRYWYQQLMRISKSTCDVIDVHLNVDNTESIRLYIDAIDSLQQTIMPGIPSLPLTSLEWSQAKEKEAYIKENPWAISFLDNAYSKRVSMEEWNRFMDSLDYDTTFMQHAYNIMCDNNFIHACYAGLYQYGNALGDQIFSTCALLTNKTCEETLPNQPFYDLYKNITPCKVTWNNYFPLVDNAAFRIFPNPVRRYFCITSHSGEKIRNVEVMGLDGKIVTSIIENALELKVDVAGLSTGVYLVRINGSIHGKLIKTHL